MNRTIALFFTLFLFLCLASCDTRCLKFTGKTQSVNRELGSFNALSTDIQSPVRIIFYRDNSTTARLIGGKNVLPYVQARTENQILRVGIDIPRCDHLTQREITLEVPYQTLNSITHNGYDDILFRDTLQTASFSVNLTDQGDIVLPINAQQLSLSIAGTANAEVSGSVEKLDVTTSDDPFKPSLSFGIFRGKNLLAKNCTVLLQGEGDCEVQVSDTLNVGIKGVGNVIYYGNPKVIVSNITGAGKLIKGD